VSRQELDDAQKGSSSSSSASKSGGKSKY
jgi:hypothetical protein